MNLASGATLRIGAWRVDPSAWEVSRDGSSVRLEARAMNVLLCLAARPGKVVSIEELLKEVWPGVVVTSDSVYQAVASLRRLLGDDARQPAYIETVPRLGYRLVAPVSAWVDERAAAAAATPAHGPEPAGPRPNGRSRAAALAAVGVGLCLLLIGYLQIHGRLTHAFTGASVAVLPLLDLTSQQMNEEVFADGMTEELIDKLSKIRGVRVPAPTSSFYFKGKQVTVAEFAKALKVTYVLDGSIRKSAATMRVAVRLIRAEDGYVVWSQTYDRPISDKLLLQDDIASQVAQALRSSLT
jgi:transcriptional activator of cad operon